MCMQKRRNWGQISLETSYPRWADRGNPKNEDTRTRKGPRGDLKACIQGKSEHSWPLKNMGLTCVGPLLCRFFSIDLHSSNPRCSRVNCTWNWNKESGSALINHGQSLWVLGSQSGFHSLNTPTCTVCFLASGLSGVHTNIHKTGWDSHQGSEFCGKCRWMSRQLQCGMMTANKAESVGCYESIQRKSEREGWLSVLF